ncbi:COG1361 S-layer family protein [Peptoniphilus sp. oral taxon 386]|uniref:COG1361 S-layer family protein n=1 Tax=Peptoniphilus sp. oral taxon 386 TaxID=652713 RepID=UPI0001DA9DF3|nr:hypothetical protein [Peptoniphilus sp. oral taxon 386]EFI41462.1 outer membrane insertion signal domain protein [Peptoniphilus sp. oral taxon 386 str. F0131]
MKRILSIFMALLILIGTVSEKTYATSVSNKLTVIADQTKEVGEGGYVVVGVNIKNNSNIPVKRVTAQAFIENPDKAYIDGDGYILSAGYNFNNSSDNIGNFRIRTDADFTTKTVPIKIELRYYIEKTNEYVEQKETIYVRVVAPEKAVNPAIEISKVDSLWLNSVDAGREFQVPFEVKNTGDSVAKNIKVSLEGLESGKITLANGLSTADITRLNPGQSQFIYFNLKSSRSTPAGSYMLGLDYKFTGEKETSSPIEGKYKFSIDLLKSKITPSSLEFKNVSFPTGAIGRNQDAKISFDLVNTGKFVAENIKVTANSQDQTGLASKSVSQINHKSLKPNESAHFVFDFISTPSAETKNYPVEIKAVFSDESTDSSQEASQIVGVFVKAPKEKDPNAKDESPVPKLIIEEYSFDPQIIEAGKPFKMYLKLYNTNANKAVRNIKIFLTSDTQESATGNSSDSKGSSNSTASVFTPVGSSNTFYIDNINPGKRVDKEITLTTVPDTAAKTYTVVANFEYEDSKANKYTATEQIGVPVVQQAKLDVGEIIAQGDFSIGMETPLSVDFYNTGKATLYNVLIKITGDGVKFDTPTYYKGNFQPGSSDQFSVNVNPETDGKKKLTLTFTFEDSTGATQTITRDFDFTVEKMMIDENMPDDINNNVGSKNKITKIVGGIILLAAVIGTGVLIKKRRDKKKQEDEDLTL